MQSIILLHTNDIHGRVDGLARIATAVSRIRRENRDTPVLYVDAGDSEEATRRLSNLTKGAAMHRLLTAAGCDLATVGNAAPMRYGPAVLAEHARSAGYPLVLANLREPGGVPVPGVQPTAKLDLAGVRVGFIGLTAAMDRIYEESFGLEVPPTLPLAQELAAALMQDGVDAVIVLSHLGLPDDRELAAALPEVPLIVGAHTHHLLPEGERVGATTIVQAGEYAEHLGRVDLLWDGVQLRVERAGVIPIGDDVAPSAAVVAEMEAVEAELAAFLAEPVGWLAQPLDLAYDRECATANLVADMLRERMGAEVGLVAAGQAFDAPLPAGPLSRGQLWDACSSTANPGVVTLTGRQLLALVERGVDPRFAAEQPRPLRGRPRGLLHLSGAELRGGGLWVSNALVKPDYEYRVAATDWELEPYGGYAEAAWQLKPTYDVPTILREALEEYLPQHPDLAVRGGRLG